jgi:beta-N-acetylhexosaminidase
MDVKKTLEAMSLEERAGQLVMEDFVGRREIPGDAVEALASGAVGSILYFSGCNVVDGVQLRSLTELVQKAARSSRSAVPAFVAIDQEGGQLAAIAKGVTIHPGNMGLGAVRNAAGGYAEGERAAFNMGRITGEELAAIGVTSCFAPVVDLCHEEGLPVKDNRYFGSDPVQAAALGAAFARGVQTAGVMACAKHFPGQRNVDIDSHFELDSVPWDEARVMAREWLPFRSAIAADLAMAMTLHAAFPLLDPSGLPATLSRAILGGYLRNKLGFKGLVVSDDIQMKPIKDKYGIDGALVECIGAGVDIVIVSGGVREANKIIADAVRKGRLPEERLNEAAAAVLAAKAKWIPDRFPSAEKARSTLLSAEHVAKLRDVADKSIALLKNDAGVLPKTGLPAYARTVIIRPTFGRLMMSDNTNFYTYSVRDVFAEYFPNVSEYVVGLEPTDTEILGAMDWGFMADFVVFCTYNAYQFRNQLKLLDGVLKYTGDAKIAVAALRSPQDLVELGPKVKTLAASFGVAECSMRSLARVLAGAVEPSGVLPVGVGHTAASGDGAAFPRGAGLVGFVKP